VLHYALRQKDC